MPHYLALIQPFRDDFLTNPDDDEMALMSEHFEYLQGLVEADQLVLAGPTLDESDPIGVYVLEAATEAAARALLEDDPAIDAGIQDVVRFQPMKLSLYRGMD